MCETTNMKRRENIESSLEWIRQVCLGLRFPLDELLLKGKRFMDDKCMDMAEELAGYTGQENQILYRCLFAEILFFLYAACNKEDRVAISVIKIAETFVDQEPCKFEKTIFAEMIRSVPIHKYGAMEKKAYSLLSNELSRLEAEFDYKIVPKEIPSVVKSALQCFLDVNGLSCTGDEDKYHMADRELRIAQAGVAGIMGLR